jgi:hypothetical protein
MEIEFVLLPEDILALHEYLWDHPEQFGRKRAGSLWIFLVAFGLLTAISIAVLATSGEWNAMTIFAPTVFVLLLCLQFFGRRLLRRQVRRNLERKADANTKALLGWRRITLAPEGIRTASESSNTTAFWPSIEKIVIGGEQAFIFNSARAAHVIPRRAFADEAAFREFVAAARRYRDAAQDSTSEQVDGSSKPREPDTNILSDERPDH